MRASTWSTINLYKVTVFLNLYIIRSTNACIAHLLASLVETRKGLAERFAFTHIRRPAERLVVLRGALAIVFFIRKVSSRTQEAGFFMHGCQGSSRNDGLHARGRA